jgi:hypothetical protein
LLAGHIEQLCPQSGQPEVEQPCEILVRFHLAPR